MKRGLKVGLASPPSVRLYRYNLFPDEKGTERLSDRSEHQPSYGVTTYSPMKRGLKVRVHRHHLISDIKLQPIPR